MTTRYSLLCSGTPNGAANRLYCICWGVLYVYLFAKLNVLVHNHMSYTYVFVSACIHICAHMHGVCIFICAYVFVSVCIHIYAHMHGVRIFICA